MKIQIKHDVYDIAKRIRYIDRDYYIVYDTLKRVYEIHNSSQLGSSYCLTSPYDTLDDRVLKYVRETSSANIENILEKIDIKNRIRENAEKSRVLSQFNDVIETKMKEKG